jgi:hypothetical protein
MRDWLRGSLAPFEPEVRDRDHHEPVRDLDHAGLLAVRGDGSMRQFMQSKRFD